MNEDWKRLGDYVVARREALGMGSRRAFEQVTGLSYRILGDLERGSRSLSSGTLATVEQALQWQSGSALAIARGGEPTLSGKTSDVDPTPVTWIRGFSEGYQIAAELHETGQIGVGRRLTSGIHRKW